jgi:putative molybdopterin biosynthesis protein
VNAGSQGGLIALKRGEAHLAGSHLLDPVTGEYNISYIQQYLPGIPVILLEWVRRQQGLLVKPGNPKNILSLNDLTRPDVSIVNRQRGAGTRVLLDYHLQLLQIQHASIIGYSEEEYTHLAVAAAVNSNRADCGLGIAAAAEALGLDFIPLFDERYDLVIPVQYFDSLLLEPLRELMQDEVFKGEIARLRGYNVNHMGRIVSRIN